MCLMLDGGWVLVHRAKFFGTGLSGFGEPLVEVVCVRMHVVCVHVCMCVRVCVQRFIQDFRIGGETQHLGGSGGMFPQEVF